MKCDKILKLFKKLRSSPIFAPEFYKSIYNTAESSADNIETPYICLHYPFCYYDCNYDFV